MSTMEVSLGDNGHVSVEEATPVPVEPPDYEYAGIFDGDMRFLSCTHCGALVAADAANITRHNDTHRHQTVIREPDDDLLTGEDLAQLLRDRVKAEMHDRGVTQVQLSKMAGVSQKHLSQMFTGNAVGSLELWSKIASVMNRRWAVSLVDE
jgi:ribosome-binding protein aMBF1 (putative translation factor)